MDGIPAAPAAPAETIGARRLIAFLIMVFGMFMSILDIQIVSASLAEIQAGLSASASEVAWVQTSYLIAEVIAIPLSGFLSRALGTRLLFSISAAGFTAASFMCGLTSTIEQMILWRAIQGFVGAGMIPTVFASAYTVFPRSKFHIVGPIIGLVATLAPTIGPTVGGYITDLMSWHWLFFINVVPGIGITLGVLIGVLPGLGGANGVAILLPLTFSMSPTAAIIMLSSIYWGALFGGAITSILFNIPGEPWSVATTFDGHPMAQQGRAAEALTAAFSSSFVGAFLAVVVLTFLAPIVADFALAFGPAEFFAVQLLTFCSFVGMGRESPFKVLAAMMLGFALAAVGMDSVTGTLRMTFGTIELMRGFDFLIAVIGLFGVGEILLTMEEGLAFRGKSAKINLRVVLQTWGRLASFWVTYLRSAAVGCWLGITPGGATPASFMSYGLARWFSRNGHKFGTGEIEGVVAPETAAHAAGTSALLPMLTLGIPGSPTAAVMLGGLLIWGLQPGPTLFVEQKDFVWGLIASMYLSNVVGFIIVLTTVPAWAAILRIPFSIIAPIILVLCAIGAYTVHNALLDVALMLVFGVIGYVFKKLNYPLAPLVLALVLGDMAESSFRRAMLISQGDIAIFWSNWLVGSICLLAMIMLFWPLIAFVLERLKARKPAELL